MKAFKKDGKTYLHKTAIVTGGGNGYSDTATLINDDGAVSSGGGNGWEVYTQSANEPEVYNMLNSAINADYPRWQLNYNTYGTDNCICYFKTPEKGIITKIDTYTWWDDNRYQRGCSSFDIYGFNSEADLLAFTNGTKIFECRITIHSNLKGALHTISAIAEQPFQYIAIKMNIVNASDGYKSIGRTKFYMRLPLGGTEIKYFGFK